MALYNITAVGSSTGIVSFVQNVNTELLGGWLGVFILIMVGAVLLSSFYYRSNDFRVSLASTNFILLALSLLLRVLDLIQDKVLFLIAICCAIVIAFTWR